MLPEDLRWVDPSSTVRTKPALSEGVTEDAEDRSVGELLGEDHSGPSDPRCPSGFIFVAGDSFELGEWELERYQKWVPDYVLHRAAVQLESFCMARYPFPGRKGALWPRDGLDLDILPELERQLETMGRRSCTVLELTLGAAGPENYRYPSDREERSEGVCDPSDSEPSPLGSFANCVSPLGFNDFLARASWARIDEKSRAALTAQGAQHQAGFEADYLVAGGMGRQDTIQAPTNFGIHLHQRGEPAFLDDGIRLCADPGPQDPAMQVTYERWLRGYFARRYFKDALGLTQGR